MIDDVQHALSLVERIKEHLPLRAKSTAGLARSMRERGAKMKSGQMLEITDVIYMGDEGGIGCALAPLTANSTEALVTSITHLRISNKHPLGAEIRAFQQERIRRLAKQT